MVMFVLYFFARISHLKLDSNLSINAYRAVGYIFIHSNMENFG